MPVPEELVQLTERFAENLDAYRSGLYKEAQLRQEFLDPFFKLLGWDVDNVEGSAEAYKDVIHEDSIKVGGGTEAPDYCFRIGGTRKFFVEAKKPSVYVKEEIPPAFQLRRYAWSAKLPLSILTDFEEFAVYDCRIKPVKTDKASTARIFYCTFREYQEHWDWIASIFTKEAIRKGSFDRFAESTKTKRGTAEVDRAFLEEIEGWREQLARNVLLRNPGLSQRDLNFAVQKIIDRIVFLRICEDRGIEPYGRLRAFAEGAGIYERLGVAFHEADERYNSGLFHFRREKDRNEPPDELTPRLQVDDKILKEILRTLYYPESPYEFSVLPVDILGQVYEQFLGKVIVLKSPTRAEVEEKPEVRKAGGVFYTPTYIVDYIVKHTLGPFLEGRGPEDIRAGALRVLDPACGSGSFLLGAYQYLLDWHRDWYNANGPEKWSRGKNPRLVQTGSLAPRAAARGESRENGWRLTLPERKRILLDHIFGVDIDPQAVEVTKLSLLIKVVEGETGESLENQRTIYHERALPDLGANIKCGNSLIGPDIYRGRQMEMFDEEELYRINAFDWRREFPSAIASGGFQAVIGNPPYGASLTEDMRSYLSRMFEATSRDLDSYCLFIEQALKLAEGGGRISMIVPTGWYSGAKFSLLRRYVSTHSDPEVFVNLPYDVFRAWVDT
ncbi:MAG: N-6 DNA methylase, partial [Candidatus Omnitrophica bacterium]|nr:N-6 DNA methylase [Candidatus Omnitrophota bacterium]